MLHSMDKQGKVGYVAVKIDFKKLITIAFGGGIRESLMELRLPKHLVEIVMNCIMSTKLHILCNGEPLEEFSRSHGTRQGDSLSPYL